MSSETPKKIAILGGGPIGLEAALYARFLGFEVTVFEQGKIANNVAAWGHVKMFSPFAMNSSPLGVAAVSAQDTQYSAPSANDLLTGDEFRERYLLPLGESDLLVDHVQTQTRVLSLGRQGFLKDEAVGQPNRSAVPFRLLTVDSDGSESYHHADVVIDCTGTWNQPRQLGPSGIPAIGERSTTEEIEYRIPDFQQQESLYGNRHTLLVGSGYSAATTLTGLSELVTRYPETRVTWVTRDETARPFTPIPEDPLVERSKLTETANQLAQDANFVRHLPGSSVKAMQKSATGNWKIEIEGSHEQLVECDQVIANVGFKPNMEMLSELQIHQCYASEGPMKLAAMLLSSSATDCLQQPKTQAETLMTTEVDFYLLGSKSYGRNSQFLLASGLTQIRELFTVIAGRDELNLYDTIQPSP